MHNFHDGRSAACPHLLQVSGVLQMPYEQQQGTLGLRELPASAVPFSSIPDTVWPSDHLAVGAVLRFT